VSLPQHAYSPPAPMLTPQDAARIFNVANVTIRRWIRSGRLRAVRVDTRLRISSQEIDRVLKERQVPADCPEGDE
jgi:excisionase family DNA binding protein